MIRFYAQRCRLRLIGRGEPNGDVRLVAGVGRLSVDVYRWKARRWKAWKFWRMGIVGDVRLGRWQLQVRWM